MRNKFTPFSNRVSSTAISFGNLVDISTQTIAYMLNHLPYGSIDMIEQYLNRLSPPGPIQTESNNDNASSLALTLTRHNVDLDNGERHFIVNKKPPLSATQCTLLYIPYHTMYIRFPFDRIRTQTRPPKSDSLPKRHSTRVE